MLPHDAGRRAAAIALVAPNYNDGRTAIEHAGRWPSVRRDGLVNATAHCIASDPLETERARMSGPAG